MPKAKLDATATADAQLETATENLVVITRERVTINKAFDINTDGLIYSITITDGLRNLLKKFAVLTQTATQESNGDATTLYERYKVKSVLTNSLDYANKSYILFFHKKLLDDGTALIVTQRRLYSGSVANLVRDFKRLIELANELQTKTTTNAELIFKSGENNNANSYTELNEISNADSDTENN